MPDGPTRDDIGKTTILFKLSLGEVVVTHPTIGSNVEEVRHGGVHLHVWVGKNCHGSRALV